MTPEQTMLVKSSWEKVLPISDKAAELFYGRLFELDPDLKSLFKGDMEEQGRKLMRMISTAVAALDRLEAIVPAVQQLGVRHVGYGVKDEHYDTVGAALLWTLQQGLGEGFTADVKEAWTSVYGVLAGTMKSAAAEAAA
ncbi:MAG: hemin receptor [Gammaproteobacteria bacterium]|jgi:hemoglobin-like flavoprotein|nr:MAG: hemin receptor [Gammaproteobacteria bacterium]